MKDHIIPSSGDIFIDLGFTPEEAAVLTFRTELLVDIREGIRTKGLTQAQAAKLFGVTQPRVSDLMRGKWDKFSLETLVTFAIRLGLKVNLIHPPVTKAA